MEDTKQNIVTYRFNELIVNQQKVSLTLCEFFNITDFDPSQFFDSSFWCTLNSLEDDEWFTLCDEVIERIGYKGTVARMDNVRNNMFAFIKKHFIENSDYKLALEQKRGTVHNKLTLKMKRDSFKMLLMSVNTQNSKQIYRYLIAFENQVKKYAIYQTECEMFKKNQEIQNLKTVKAPLPLLNKYQANRLKSKRVQKYVYVATTKNNACNDLYKIGSTDSLNKRKRGMNSSHVRDNDIIYYVHTVKAYNAVVLEHLIHAQLEDYQYKEQATK